MAFPTESSLLPANCLIVADHFQCWAAKHPSLCSARRQNGLSRLAPFYDPQLEILIRNEKEARYNVQSLQGFTCREIKTDNRISQTRGPVNRKGRLRPKPLPEKLGLRQPESKEDALNLNMTQLVAGGHGLLFGTRIPKHFFLAKGHGETDQGTGADPWETGSFDVALESAGIQDFNIQYYTSVMPPEATPISFEEAKPFFRHGAVLESILATMNGIKGDRIAAGVGRMQIRRKRDKYLVGGYAAEYKGHANEEEARRILECDLKGIFERRFNADEFEVFEEDYIIQVNEVEKGFGTVLAAICFITYVEPVYISSP